MSDAVVVEHGDALLVDAVGDLGNGEAGGTDLVASELEGALQGLRGGAEVQDVANRLDLGLQALGLGGVAGLEGAPEVDDDVGDQVRGARDGAAAPWRGRQRSCPSEPTRTSTSLPLAASM